MTLQQEEGIYKEVISGLAERTATSLRSEKYHIKVEINMKTGYNSE